MVLAGRYRLLNRIAVGGMGEVWRAADVVLDRVVAVKVLRDEYAQHPETLARFRAEARHAGSLSHPGIAQVYDYGESGPAHRPFLVMELVDGPPLSQLIASGPLPAVRVMDIVAQAADGLAAAHAAGLVHRDIKPGNMLMDRAGRIKITDFGIAHAAGSAPITGTGMLIGTPAYLSPERVEGGPATAASDLYSLGIVSYECLAGAPPFTGTALEVALAHAHRALPPLPPAVPAAVATLVAELTARDPAARPASAAGLAARAARLRDVLAGPADRHATAVLGPPSGAQPAMQAPTLTTQMHFQADPVARERVPGARRGRGVMLTVAAVAVAAGLGAWLLAGGSGARKPAPQHQEGRTAATAQSPFPARTVEVNSRVLVGQPVGLVTHRLRELGLHVRLTWTIAGPKAAGKVLSVHPAGRVPADSTVTVTGALLPAGHGHHNGNGNGNGKGKGKGKGRGGG
jgi:serine/threonine-protein kinase